MGYCMEQSVSELTKYLFEKARALGDGWHERYHDIRPLRV
jgi:hypothetical protein